MPDVLSEAETAQTGSTQGGMIWVVLFSLCNGEATLLMEMNGRTDEARMTLVK